MATQHRYVIFDLDGTLININSIQHLIGDWEEFHPASVKCPPNEAMVEFARRCQQHSDIILITGKPERFRRSVIDWLRLQGIDPDFVLMRPELCSLSDAELKPHLAEKLLGSDWADKVLFAVEDRDKMVNAWRAAGINCLQCAESLY